MVYFHICIFYADFCNCNCISGPLLTVFVGSGYHCCCYNNIVITIVIIIIIIVIIITVIITIKKRCFLMKEILFSD